MCPCYNFSPTGFFPLGLLLIIVAGYGKATAIVDQVEVIGGIIACGVFLLLISLVGKSQSDERWRGARRPRLYRLTNNNFQGFSIFIKAALVRLLSGFEISNNVNDLFRFFQD